MADARRFRERPPEDVCVVMLSALGDAVHVLPVVNALKRAWPSTRITWVLQPAAFDLARGHESVDRFVVFHRRRGPGAWIGFREVAGPLRERSFDLVLSLQTYAKAGILAAMARADVKLGFDRARARDLNWLATNDRIPARPVQHVQDQYFEFLDHLGVAHEPVEWRVPLTAEDREVHGATIDGLDRPACALVVGTSNPKKNWTPEGYARVADALAADFDMQPVIVGGPSAAERSMAEAVRDRATVEVVDALGDGVRRLVALLAAAAMVISPDTGPLHLARALDTPVVGLFGHTNPKRHGPYRKFEDLVVDGYARRPGERYPPSTERRPDGMSRITVDRVLEKVERARGYLASPGGRR